MVATDKRPFLTYDNVSNAKADAVCILRRLVVRADDNVGYFGRLDGLVDAVCANANEYEGNANPFYNGFHGGRSTFNFLLWRFVWNG